MEININSNKGGWAVAHPPNLRSIGLCFYWYPGSSTGPEKDRVSHFIIVVDVWQISTFRLPGVNSPVLSPEVLRLHIFDIEPPSVAGCATKDIVRQITNRYIKISLHFSYALIKKSQRAMGLGNCSNFRSLPLEIVNSENRMGFLPLIDMTSARSFWAVVLV